MKLDFLIGSQSSKTNIWLGTGIIRFTATLLLLWWVMFCSAGIVAAQEDLGGKAFSKRKYPWYNPQTGQAQRIEMNDRPEIRSGNRNLIPLKPVNIAAKTKTNRGNPGSLLKGLSLFAWVAIGLLIAVITAMLFWAFLSLQSNVPTDEASTQGRSMAESIKQLPFELDSESGDFRQAARLGYLAGDYRKAIIYLFSHVLVSLDQKGHIRLRKGKTNRQYLGELRPYRSLADFYQRVMVPFEATFFGDHELDKQEFESCWNQLDEFQKDIERTSQVAHG